ncbi:phosphocarrier protein [Azomonas agilis]|uniref:Phosphocarrier protein n=1 Tax=Azomonas agilis TaxID=116849 RepID=A0A562J0T7_9GAMM|nr:HPr family phosphocarrier protein [Azomonas agilis]TWH76743.1 phosphocarrier protein [Azomonas agilis]
MLTCQTIIVNKLGLHARAAAKFVTTASQFQCSVQVGRCPNTLVNGKNIMAVIMLAANQGTALHLRTEGEDEHQALQALVALIDNYFEEGE